jgi:hypothetical protein
MERFECKNLFTPVPHELFERTSELVHVEISWLVLLLGRANVVLVYVAMPG